MGNRFKDLVLLIGLTGGGAYLLGPSRSAPEPTVTPVATPVTSNGGFPELAPPFELHSNLGPPRSFDGRGPLVVTLTAVGCGDCISRIPRDQKLYELAREAHIPYYNVLVFADDATGERFVKDQHPSADDVLNDPGGGVFVTQYKGSDNNCWMVIGRDGKFLYRGPENMQAMQQAMERIQRD